MDRQFQSAAEDQDLTASNPLSWSQKLQKTARFLGVVTIPTIVASGMLVYGIQGLQLARRFPAPKTLSYAQFVRQMPKSGWYRIPDASIRNSGAVVRHISSQSTFFRDQEGGYYAPVTGPGDLDDGRYHFLMCVVEGVPPVQEIETRPIEGLVEDDLDKSPSLNRDVAPLGKGLAPDYAVIEEGNSPNFGMSLVLALIGAPLTLANLVVIYMTFSSRANAPALMILPTEMILPMERIHPAGVSEHRRQLSNDFFSRPLLIPLDFDT